MITLTTTTTVRRPAALTLDRLERAGRRDLRGEARRQGIDGELLACQALDVAQVAPLLVRAEGDRNARRSGATIQAGRQCVERECEPRLQLLSTKLPKCAQKSELWIG